MDVAGAVATAIALLSIGAGGYLLAVLSIGSRSSSLDLAIGTLLCATAEGVLCAVALGAVGALYWELALALQGALTFFLWRKVRRSSRDVLAPARVAMGELVAWMRAHPALTLIGVNAVGLELLRAILRPPLSWDSLEYHLLLAASWLRSHDIWPILAPYRTNFQGFFPANGSLWLWWWLAPSHSELYANWAFVPQWILLSLATGGIAREIGATRSWPYASVVVALLPVVLRFATTQYADVFLAAAWLCALFQLIRWLRSPARGSALLAGIALGLAAGSKVIGLPYAVVLGVSALVLAPAPWGRRIPQVGLAVCAAIVVGSYFQLRNLWIGVGLLFPSTSPLGLPRILCDHALANPVGMGAFDEYSLLTRWGSEIPTSQVVDAFLGTSFAWSQEMGVGPVFLPLLAAGLAFPWLARTDRRTLWLCTSQLVFLFVFWVTVPTTDVNNLYANVRYLDAGLALLVAFACALLDGRRLADGWVEAIAVAASVQAVLFTQTPASGGVRVIASTATLVVLVFVLSERARALARRWGRPLVTGLVAAAFVIGAPALGRFREEDRTRAFLEEYSVHRTPIATFAPAWNWLDQNAGDERVAAVTEVRNWLYPPMGMRFQRDVRYVNYNAANRDSVTGYPNCNPRVDPDPLAWIANLRSERIRWVLTSRDNASRPFPLEARWAAERPELFRLRYSDGSSRIFEFADGTGAEAEAAGAAP